MDISGNKQDELNFFDNLKTANSETNEFTLNGTCDMGKVVYVYDGDTVHMVFNFNNKLTRFTCRLLGVDSPEICPKNVSDEIKRKQEIDIAIKSRNYLIEQVTNMKIINERMTKKEIKTFCSSGNNLVWVKCYEFDKYGRLLVELYKNKEDLVSINQDMVDKKLVVKYDGGTKSKFEENNFC
jgi:endonuclease YncB( thermonuclease family)